MVDQETCNLVIINNKKNKTYQTTRRCKFSVEFRKEIFVSFFVKSDLHIWIENNLQTMLKYALLVLIETLYLQWNISFRDLKCDCVRNANILQCKLHNAITQLRNCCKFICFKITRLGCSFVFTNSICQIMTMMWLSLIRLQNQSVKKYRNPTQHINSID